jgi:hypothetical protein
MDAISTGLKVYRTDMAAIEWALSMYYLADARQVHAGRLLGADGARLAASAAANYTPMTQTRFRRRLPQVWASAKNYLNLLRLDEAMLKEPEEQLPSLERLRSDLASLLEVATWENNPRLWAYACSNLAMMIHTIHQVRSAAGSPDPQLDAEAERLCRQVIERTNCDEFRLERANALGDLSSILLARAQNVDAALKLQIGKQAESLVREAIKSAHPKVVPTYWCHFYALLRNCLIAQADGESGEERRRLLNVAVSCTRDILKIATRGEMPHHWLLTQLTLVHQTNTLVKESEGTERKELLESAIALMREPLEFAATLENPYLAALLHRDLATALHLQSDSLEGDKKLAALTEAMESMRMAMALHEDQPNTEIYSECKAELDLMTQKLAEARKGK